MYYLTVDTKHELGSVVIYHANDDVLESHVAYLAPSATAATPAPAGPARTA